jgi:hypothetical protein
MGSHQADVAEQGAKCAMIDSVSQDCPEVWIKKELRRHFRLLRLESEISASLAG